MHFACLKFWRLDLAVAAVRYQCSYSRVWDLGTLRDIFREEELCDTVFSFDLMTDPVVTSDGFDLRT